MADKDLDGIPDADLSSVKADLEDKKADLAQFKSPDDVLKAYKEVQGFATTVSQENKELKLSQEKLEQEMTELRESQQLSQVPAQQGSNKSFDESWMENPEMTIDQRVALGVTQARITEVLEEEEMSNPDEFQERFQSADHLARNPKFAHLAKTASGTKRLFKEADKLREISLISSSNKALEHIFGGPLDEEKIAKLKNAVFGETKQKQSNDAYMPDGSTSTNTGADSDKDRDNSGAIKEAENKGDVDGVINGIFKNLMAE